MQLVPYSKSNKSCKRAAPTASDAKPRNSQKGRGAIPIRGYDYVFGYAHIKTALNKDGESGWGLPGCQWTNNNAIVMQMALEIDRMIRAAGGLPKGWMDMVEHSKQMREAS